jgi:hypothetical protein
MADELLNAIIQLEGDIQQQLEMERRRAEAWLDSQLAELEETRARALAEQEMADQDTLRAAERRADERVAQLQAATREYCLQLEKTADEQLRNVLREKLPQVLPEGDDDHRNGQG